MAISTAQKMSRIYSPTHFQRIEAQHSVAAPVLSLCSPAGKQTFVSLDDGFYATTDLLYSIESVPTLPTDTPGGDQHSEQKLVPIAPNKLNRINRLARGLFGDEVSYSAQMEINILITVMKFW